MRAYKIVPANIKVGDFRLSKDALRRLSWGIDFLGYVICPNFILSRASTRKRMLRKIESRTKDYYKGKINKLSLEQTLASYFGYLSHANTYKLTMKLQEIGGS